MKVLIPLKQRADAKRRMASALDPMQRQDLVRLMVEDMLTQLMQVADIDVILLTNDSLGADLKARFNVQLMAEKSEQIPCLNSSLHAAVSALAESEPDDIAIVHGDLPLLCASEMSDVIARYHSDGDNSMLLVPDELRLGTNCMIFHSHQVPRFGYGTCSFAWHREWAYAQGLITSAVYQPGIARDMDGPNDLHYLLNHKDQSLAPATRRYLNERGLDQTVAALRSHAPHLPQASPAPPSPSGIF